VQIGNWVRAKPFIGQMWGGEVVNGGLAVYVGGRQPNGTNEKILWSLNAKARVNAGARLALTGRLAGEVRYRARFSAASDGSGALLFPSTIRLPQAGCWTLTLTTGRIKAKVVVLAQEPA
jgi:hypothetical protein